MFFPFYLSCTYFPIISCFFSLNRVGFNYYPFLSNIFRLFWFIYFMLFFPFQQHFSSSNVCCRTYFIYFGSWFMFITPLFLRLAEFSYLSIFISVFLFLLYKFYSSSFSRHFLWGCLNWYYTAGKKIPEPVNFCRKKDLCRSRQTPQQFTVSGRILYQIQH